MTEALITLGFFVALILNAWVVDTQPWKKKVYPAVLSSSPSLEEAEWGIKPQAPPVTLRCVAARACWSS